MFGRDIFAIFGSKKGRPAFSGKKKFAEKFFEGNVQLANSEMKSSFPKVFGQFNF